MNSKISPAAVKFYREKRRLSQEALVRLVRTRGRGKLEKRQLQRIESNASVPDLMNVREATLHSLARALDLPSKLLQSAPEDSPEVRSEGSERVQLNARVRASTLTKLDLIRSAYSVELEEIIDLAPLMFAYHAESSLRERRQRLEDDLQLRERFLRAIPEMQHLAGEGELVTPPKLTSESDSIRYGDIFGMWLDLETYDGLELGENPFTEYLQRLSAGFAAPSKLEVSDEFPALLVPEAETRIADYTVCTEHLDWLTRGDPELKMAILSRELLIDDIPAKLRVKRDLPIEALTTPGLRDEEAADRVEWMRRELRRQRATTASGTGHGDQPLPDQRSE